ncbi:MAG: YggS family pyridoxal phosphate-dependent enzyme [Bacteroidales bacterium]|nr:YggS family pyridoxal phosphate-dependent enzyme [Bacteroidales bacterium]MDD2425593.1 YggS family pyridoxal phosphate-dependent enzyme [Bacteroidales bacterium]MDD3988866.1 YggS family pyridoxal phosphate-dependent enzyme [Bacteroidales bacterium]MDD4639141.1 YggS family pyridoxal phosphate-dependent enzyme [Bacteroidales bacterium]
MINSGRLSELLKELPPGVKLVAVSKFKPPEAILEAYNQGVVNFGENRPQELETKMEQLPGDIRWHFIGHLQRNKVKLIIRRVSLIHSVDSVRLAAEIDSRARELSLVKDCLLQIRIANEETKQGIEPGELDSVAGEIKAMPNVRICGVMGMATNTPDIDIVSKEFALLKFYYRHLKETLFINDDHFCEISAGMSSDWRVAVENGSTIIRVGSLIFGER